MPIFPTLEEAQGNLYHAQNPSLGGFTEGIPGGHETFSSWFTSGISGLIGSKFASNDLQRDWFVQRHSIDASVNQIDNMLDAWYAVGEHRNYNQAEYDEIKELQARKAMIERDLAYVFDNASGNLDAPIDAEGGSFNDRWGIDREDELNLSKFLETAKENPSYMAGVLSGELLKDLPLSVVAWLGLSSKGLSMGKGISQAINKLNNIKPKALRGLAKVSTGLGSGTALGAGYETAYGLLDEGDVKPANVKAGAAFGTVFGLLGVAGIFGRTAKDLQTKTHGPKPKDKPKPKDTPVKKEPDIEDTANTLVNPKEVDNIVSPFITMFKEHNTRLFPELKEGVDYKVINGVKNAEKRGALNVSKNKAAQLRQDKNGNNFIILNESKYNSSIKNLKKELKDNPKKWFSDLSAKEAAFINTKVNKDIYKPFLVAHELAHIKRNRELINTGIDPKSLTKEQLLQYKKKNELEANNMAVQEMRRSYDEIDRAKHNESEKSIEAVKKEVMDRVDTPKEKIDDAVGTPSKTAAFLEKNPKVAYGLGAAGAAGAYGLTGEEGDPLSNALLVGGAAVLGAKAYKVALGQPFKKAVAVAKYKIAKKINLEGSEAKVFESQMQWINEKVDELFISSSSRANLVKYLETEGKGAPKLETKEHYKVAKEIRDFLNELGLRAMDAGLIKSQKDLVKLEFGKFNKNNDGGFLENYFPHIIKFKGISDDKLIEELVKKYGTLSSRNTKLRTIQGGLDDINKWLKNKYPDGEVTVIADPVIALQAYTTSITRAIIGRNIISSMKKLDLGNGGKDGRIIPAILTHSELDSLTKVSKKDGKAFFNEQEGLHYTPLKHPSLKDYVVHTNVKTAVDDYFAISYRDGVAGTMEKVLRLNNVLKRVFVFGSLFHAQALFMSGVYSMGLINAIKLSTGKGSIKMGDKRIDVSQFKLGSGEFKTEAKRFMEAGLEIVNIRSQELVVSGAKPLDDILDKAGTPGAKMAQAFKVIDKLTWEQLHDRFKLAAAMLQEEKLLKQGVREEVALSKASDFANDAFGSQKWDKHMEAMYKYVSENPNKLRSKFYNKAAELLPANKRRWLNLGLFAPDWTISNIRIVGKTFTDLPKVSKAKARQIQLGYWESDEAREIVKAWNMYAAYATRAGFYTSGLWFTMTKLFGDEEPSAEKFVDFWVGNDSGRLDLGNGESMVISKQIAEPMHWVLHPYHTLLNKSSVVPKTMVELLFNKQWFSMKKGFPMGPKLSEDDGTSHHAKWLLGKVLPIVTKPLINENLSWTERFERVFTGFFGFPQYGSKDK